VLTALLNAFKVLLHVQKTFLPTSLNFVRRQNQLLKKSFLEHNLLFLSFCLMFFMGNYRFI